MISKNEVMEQRVEESKKATREMFKESKVSESNDIITVTGFGDKNQKVADLIKEVLEKVNGKDIKVNAKEDYPKEWVAGAILFLVDSDSVHPCAKKYIDKALMVMCNAAGVLDEDGNTYGINYDIAKANVFRAATDDEIEEFHRRLLNDWEDYANHTKYWTMF